MRWLIGDVHGMLRSLEALLEEVSRVDPAAKFYFLGDYVNRGPDSKGVLDLLISLKDAKFIRGNHDDILDHIVNGQAYAEESRDGENRLASFQWFLQHGLDATYESYGVEYADLEFCAHRPTIGKLEKVNRAIPETHRRFIRELPPVIEEEDLFMVHAKWDTDQADHLAVAKLQGGRNPVLRHKLLWGRFSEAEIDRPKAWKRTGYFGHTPVYAYAASQETGELAVRPIAGQKMVLLDTGAALSEAGRLTAYCPEEQIFVQADHFGKIVIA